MAFVTSLASVPTAQPQPDQLTFPIDALALFHTYTRESYRAAFGVEPPPWNPSRVSKAWFDSTVSDSAGGQVAYQAVGQDAAGTWRILPFSIPAAEAATVNLPGSITFPAYTIAPTSATRGGSPINPAYLALEPDAEWVMAALGGFGLFDDGATAIFPNFYPPDEPRRSWAFLWKGRPINVGQLLVQRNANGVGAPGQWDVSSGSPVWVAKPLSPSGLNDTRPAQPVPVRALFANEQLQPVAMGFGVQVLRTDLQLAVAKTNGEFTQDDRAALTEVLALVRKLVP